MFSISKLFFIVYATFHLGSCSTIALNGTYGVDSIMCPPSAQKDCILAIMRPLPDSPSTIRAEATAYTYKSNCEKIGNGTKIGHDGTATLDDAPGGSIGIQGFLNDNFTDEHKYNWAAVKFTHASDGPGLMGLKHTVPNADEQGSLWTCGNVDGISRCHITIHC